MYIGIVEQGGKSLENLIFQTENVNLTEKGVIESDYSVELLPVNKVIMSTNSIRTKFTLTIEIVVKSGIFYNNGIMYVEFPNIFFEAMFFKWNPVC